MAENSTMEIILVRPPVPDPNEKTMLVLGCLSISFVMSVAGNSSQFAWQQHAQKMHKQISTFTSSPLLFNIKLLYFVQFMISMTLPAVLVDYLLEFWSFGSFACSCHFVLLNFGRTASSWLIFSCILYQVLQVNSLRISDKRRRFINLVINLAILFFGVLLLMPTLRHIQLVQEVERNENLELRIERCILGIHNSQNRLLINSAVFIVDFALPLILCSSLVIYLRRFRQQNQQLMGAQDSRIQYLLTSILAIYFICSLPHFIAIALILFAQSLNFYLYSYAATAIADLALIFTYIPPATLWIPLGDISRTIFEGIVFGSQHCLTLNSTTRTRVFSNQSFTSECHSLPGNLSRACTKEQLKPSVSLNPLDVSTGQTRSAKNSTSLKRPNFKEIKLTNRSNKERLLRLEPSETVDEHL